ncbi:MAG: RdgB/HAM1 family non-canonical purine NTP pyrophosphatase [Planctomycetota bacterium]|nr:RdgB/HAM1 family non-canonical purine NTP pyrophosphatase [Planctomycetota bacterium]
MVGLQEVLIASGNPKKIREIRGLLAPLSVQVLTSDEVGPLPEVIEDAPTFADNAAKKARETAIATGRWCLADDSGLEVDALDGAPGVFSARFAGKHGDDEANNEKLLSLLEGKPREQRGARFVCALALADPQGEVTAQFEGTAEGLILDAPRGSGDFGYDPLFLFTEEGHDQTGQGFAELAPDAKSAISHRGRALQKFIHHLAALEVS